MSIHNSSLQIINHNNNINNNRSIYSKIQGSTSNNINYNLQSNQRNQPNNKKLHGTYGSFLDNRNNIFEDMKGELISFRKHKKQNQKLDRSKLLTSCAFITTSL